jgi:hypothetical protein
MTTLQVLPPSYEVHEKLTRFLGLPRGLGLASTTSSADHTGFSLAVETTSCVSPICSLKNCAERCNTLKGPSYGLSKGPLGPSLRTVKQGNFEHENMIKLKLKICTDDFLYFFQL